NLRVAFAEGNLPRIISTALLPAAFYFLINLLEHDGRKRDFFALVLLVGLIVLSHAMMAGIFLLGFGMYSISYWLVGRGSLKTASLGAGALTIGLFISAWWMFPSLTGGITELDNAAASEAIAQFPLSVSFNPGLRSTNHEIFYVGLSVLIATLIAWPVWSRLDPWVKSMVPVTIIMMLIGSTLIVEMWRALPAHQLFWPLRFMSFAGLLLILTSLIVASKMFQISVAPRLRWLRFAAIAIPLLMLADFQPSTALIRTREIPDDVSSVSAELKKLDGWRVATADLSRLGSAPAMLFTTEGEREQIFGWAFQGSITAPLLARVNQSMDQGHLGYTISRLERLGTDDVVHLPQPDIDANFRPALEDAGFEIVHSTGRLTLFHKDGAPRAVDIPLKVFGIGSGANNVSLLFPEVTIGSSGNIEDYDPEFLELFDVIVLSRFTFNNRGTAEEMVVNLAEQGKTIVIDLTSAPLDTLSREPKFLGVYGEPVLQISQARTIIDGVVSPLLPFTEEFGTWRSVTPQGADEVLIPFEYIAAEGTALSRNVYGEGQVMFVGLNLMFHAAVTNDPLAIRILESTLGIKAGQPSGDTTIPLDNYVANEDGWRFDITLPEHKWVLLPMGLHAGTSVEADGEVVEIVGVESLTLAHLPAGTSSVHIRSDQTTIYTIGKITTVIGVLATIYYLLGGVRASLGTRLSGWREGRNVRSADPPQTTGSG
ncbi:MAG: 6-pyruvoyl-tetrahydropterin synthase-related protein, partial [Dehalococcoidia bacterium]